MAECPICFPFELPSCPETIVIRAGLQVDTLYYVKLTDKFGNAFNTEATTDGAGELTLTPDDFLPLGFLNPAIGSFTIEISDTNEPFSAQNILFFCDELYTCITVTVSADTSLSNIIQCASSGPPPPPTDFLCEAIEVCLGIPTEEGNYVLHIDEEGEITWTAGGGGGGLTCDDLEDCEVIQDMQAAIAENANDIADEAIARNTADSILQNNIDAEAAARIAADALLQPLSQKAQPNGYASLDGGGKIPATQLPNSVMDLQGEWNANTNTPTLSDGTGDPGDVWEVTVAGTTNFGSGAITFNIGDWAVYGADGLWYKSINSNEVTSVFSRTGTVTAQNGDYTASQITNTPAGGISATTVQAAIDELDSEKADKLIVDNEQADSYTLVLSDAHKRVRMNKATANNLTVPTNASVAFPVGTQIMLDQMGAGQTTVVAAGGVTINSADGALKLRVQFSGAVLIKSATNTWQLYGDLSV